MGAGASTQQGRCKQCRGSGIREHRHRHLQCKDCGGSGSIRGFAAAASALAATGHAVFSDLGDDLDCSGYSSARRKQILLTSVTLFAPRERQYLLARLDTRVKVVLIDGRSIVIKDVGETTTVGEIKAQVCQAIAEKSVMLFCINRTEPLPLATRVRAVVGLGLGATLFAVEGGQDESCVAEVLELERLWSQTYSTEIPQRGAVFTALQRARKQLLKEDQLRRLQAITQELQNVEDNHAGRELQLLREQHQDELRELQQLAEQDTQEAAENAARGVLLQDQRVMAPRQSPFTFQADVLGPYHPGTIHQVNADGTYDVIFDDGARDRSVALIKPGSTAIAEIRRLQAWDRDPDRPHDASLASGWHRANATTNGTWEKPTVCSRAEALLVLAAEDEPKYRHRDGRRCGRKPAPTMAGRFANATAAGANIGGGVSYTRATAAVSIHSPPAVELLLADTAWFVVSHRCAVLCARPSVWWRLCRVWLRVLQ
jgi:hypothetical protein